MGLRTNSPPQFGHLPWRRVSTQVEQNVHSNEQIIASRELGGSSRLQHSQLGFMSSMAVHHLLGSPTIVAAELGAADPRTSDSSTGPLGAG
jgi:hypothetical protein